MIDLPDVLQQVAQASALFAGLVYVLMEFAVKPLTVKLKARKRLRRIAAALLSAGLPTGYLALTGAFPWAWAPAVAAVAFGASWGTNAAANRNEAEADPIDAVPDVQ